MLKNIDYRAVGNIRQQVIVEGCTSWTNRLHHISQNDRNYFRS